MNKIYHVTSEILNSRLGGIATVCDKIYYNLNKNEKIILVLQNNSIIKYDNVETISLNDLGKYKFDNSDTIYFHNFILANEWLIHNYNYTCNCSYVMHSNLLIDIKFEYCFGIEDIKKFINVIENFNVIAVSNSDKNLLIKFLKLYNIKIPNIRIIYNGYDFNENNLNININKNGTFGYIGRLSIRKGLIELFNLINRSGYYLYMAGGGNGRFTPDIIKELSPYVNGSNLIKPIGYCDGFRKDTFFKSIDALIVPSIYEPFGYIILEALDNNVPVFLNEIDTFKEILGENYPFFFDINDYDSFIYITNKFYNMDNDDIKNIILETKNNCKNKFSVDNMLIGYRK